jgi:NCS1 family nucleobase:cation symporter-1
VQPWKLINRALTFITVLSSFSVFLAPIIGIMTCDYYLLRRRRIRLSHLYKTHDSIYHFWKGVNWRAIPAWICGWAPTIGGLIVSVRGDVNPPRALLQLYYMAFLIGQYGYLGDNGLTLIIALGFFISALIFYLLNLACPVEHMDQIDSVDLYGTFTPAEARRAGTTPLEEVPSIEGVVRRTASDKELSVHGEKEV